MHIRYYHEVVPSYKTGSETTQGQSYRAQRHKKIIPRVPIGPSVIFVQSPVDNNEFVIYDMFGKLKKI